MKPGQSWEGYLAWLNDTPLDQLPPGEIGRDDMPGFSSSATGPRGERLTFRQEATEISYLTDLDRNWTQVDRNGHRHYCDYEAADHYPTLLAVYDEDHWCEDCGGGCAPIDHWECRQCGEHITPGMTGPGTAWVPGLAEWTLTETLTGDAARRAAEAGDCDSVTVRGGRIEAVRTLHLTEPAARDMLAAWKAARAGNGK
jgi:hypothetical protein